MSDEEREYLNEMIRSLNNRLVDVLRERDDAREQEERFSDDALRLMEERNAAEKRIAELERDAEIKYENHTRIVATLTAERDEARFTAAYQYAKHHNGYVQTLMDNFCELKGWQKFQFFVGDDDHAKEGL